MKKILSVLIVIFSIVAGGAVVAQTKPSWLQLRDTPVLDVRIFGADSSGNVPCNDAVDAAIAALPDSSGSLG